MKVAFCTSVMNRRWQLEATIASNLEVLRGTPHLLAVCDFNSADGLADLITDFTDDITAGRLLFFRTVEPQRYHSSVAKNLAHRLGLLRRPDVLFNLDADNFITPETLAIIASVLGADPDACLHHCTDHSGDGSAGRIALSARRWQEVGGYDEALLGVAWQDIDFLYRCRAAGLTYVHRSDGLHPPVPNTMDDRIQNIHFPDDLLGPTAGDLYQSILKRNILISFGRPPHLRFEDQRRFGGLLNFSEPITL
jgi:hypothetical protein